MVISGRAGWSTLAVAVVVTMWSMASARAQDTPAAVPGVEIVFGTGVDRSARTITGQNTVFSVDDFLPGEGRIFCLTHIQNLVAPAKVTHVWYHEGKTMARVDLRVGSVDWRTWSAKRFLPAWTGSWEVKVLDSDGMVLASAGFTIE